MQSLKRLVLSLILALALLGSAFVVNPSSHLLADAVHAHSLHICQSCGSNNRLLANTGSTSGGDPGNG